MVNLPTIDMTGTGQNINRLRKQGGLSPGNDPHSHAPFFVNPGDGKAHIILLAGSPVVVAGVGHSIHAVRQADIDHALMYIRDLAGMLALDAAFF